MEKMIVHQQRNFPAGSEFVYGAQDERPEPEVADVFAKFMQGCYLRAVGVDPAGLEKETAGIERRATEIYRKTILAGAKTAPAPPADDDAHRLEKRFMGRREPDPRTTRLEKSPNGTWIYEYSASGELLAGHEFGSWPGEK